MQEVAHLDRVVHFNVNLQPSVEFDNPSAQRTIFHKFQILDVSWTFSYYFFEDRTPLWVGYNSRICKNNIPMDRVEYLSPMNESPTKNEVIKVALANCNSIMQKTGQKYIELTVDFAIFMKALRIQTTYADYDGIFIHCGPFH